MRTRPTYLDVPPDRGEAVVLQVLPQADRPDDGARGTGASVSAAAPAARMANTRLTLPEFGGGYTTGRPFPVREVPALMPSGALVWWGS